MLEDSLDTSSYARDHITGDLTVELFDAKTGKLQDKQEVHNFIARPAAERLEWGQRWFFKEGMHALNATADQDYRPFEVFNGIYLSGNTDVEDPTNERGIPLGHFIGGADKRLYSGSNSFRGSPNGALSRAEPTFTRWVFDWPTNAANGVIGSVGWTNWASVSVDNSIAFSSHATLIQRIHANPDTVTGGYIRRAGSQIIMAGSTNVIRIHNSDFMQTGSFTASLFTLVTGIVWDAENNRLWMIGYLTNTSNWRVAAYSLSGDVLVGATSIDNSRIYHGLTLGGGALYATVRASTAVTEICSIDFAGNVESAFNISTNPNNLGSSIYPSYEVISDINYDNGVMWTLRSNASSATRPGSGSQSFSLVSGLVAYSLSGVLLSPIFTLGNVDQPSHPVDAYVFPASNNYNYGFDYEGGGVFLMCIGRYACRIRLNNLGSRALLPSPIAKTDTQTLRVTYQMNYT